MESMEVASDEEMEELSPNNENQEISNEAKQKTDDSANSPISFDKMATDAAVHEDLQAKLQIANPKSQQNLEAIKSISPTNRGDGVEQRTFKSKDAIPSTSKVIVKRKGKEPRIREILRPILPRKSKDRAKQLLKVIAKGIIVPRGAVLWEMMRRRSRRRVRKPMKALRQPRRGKMARSSLQTVWARDRVRRPRSQSPDSFHSGYECRCRNCNTYQY